MNIEYVLHFTSCDLTIQYFIYKHVSTETICKTVYNVYHNIYDAAYISYNVNKCIIRVIYYINDQISRKYGPAITDYYSNGNISLLYYRIKGIHNRHYDPYKFQYRTDGILYATTSWQNGKNVINYNENWRNEK